jgi:hypothetical protein
MKKAVPETFTPERLFCFLSIFVNNFTLSCMRFLPVVLYFFLFLCSAGGQNVELNKGNAFVFQIAYGFQWPAADLADRYGVNNRVGLGTEFITEKSNLIFGFESTYLFGNQVKTDVLANLRTAEGFLIGNDRAIADILLKQRGFYFGTMAGKLFPLSLKEPRSGLRITFGAGLLQHKIRIQDDPQRLVASLTDEYKKGYDRLSNGLAFKTFIGYQMLSKDRLINFYAGIDACLGFTQNRRSLNFDTQMQDLNLYQDLLLGLRVGWMLPIYTGKAAREIFY